MFNKIDRNILIVSIIIIIVIIASGWVIYKCLNPNNPKVENTAGGLETQSTEILPNEQNNETLPVEIQAEVKATGTTGQGQLLICIDKCGDGICQGVQDDCGTGNCSCPEDKTDCPQDCK